MHYHFGSLCSSSDSEAQFVFFNPLVTLIFLPIILLTSYLSLAWILYSLSRWYLFTLYQRQFWFQSVLPYLGPYTETFGLLCIFG